MTVVVDASVVVAALASADATGQWAESVLAGEPLAAPHLMPVEAASILHRAELAGEISADAASLAHADLGRLRVEYFPYDPFAERIWELRSPGLAATPGSPEPAPLLFPPGPASSGTDDPAEMLSEGYEQQAEMLRHSVDHLWDQARAALAQGREDLALESLARKKAVEAELGELRDQYESLRQQTDRPDAASQQLQAKIDARRRPKEAGERTGHPGLTSYEAWYVALAEFLGTKLATLDARLALVPGPRCGFCLPSPPPG
jgi:predicted nucleic acid-binding protein